MKAIHYDTEGDILSVTFTEVGTQGHTGVELSDNIVLYYNPETEQPLKLLLLSYRGLLQAGLRSPLLLDGLAQAPTAVQKTVMTLLQKAPLPAFLQLVESNGRILPTGRLQEIFTPNTLQTVAAN